MTVARWLKVLQWFEDYAYPSPDKHSQLGENAMVKVLFVCMGNVCRSPMAEGVLRRMLQDRGLADKVYVDSAGTHSYHIGSAPDERSQATASRRGVDLSMIRVRRVVTEDLAVFDYVLAMDRENYDYLHALSTHPERRDKVRLLLDFASDWPEQEVPDPYYGGLNGFERVMDLLEAAAEGLLLHIRERYRF